MSQKTITLLLMILILCSCAQQSQTIVPSNIEPDYSHSDYIDHWRIVQPVTPEISGAGEDSTETEDLWDRIREKFTLTDIDHPRIKKYVTKLSRDTRYIDLLSERSQPFLYYLVEATDSRDLPVELIMVPMIESAFQADAVSPGSAAGLWQIMPATARSLGLKRTKGYDGRHDVLASTQAALNYLTYLNDMFDGDWLLTLAAYNSGEGTVLKAMRKNRAVGRGTDYWSLNLPPITRQYVPKILALSRLVAEPDAYGIELEKIPDEPYLQKVEISPKIDLSIAAASAGISKDEIYQFNPAYNLDAQPSGLDSYKLLLPLDSARALRSSASRLGDTRINRKRTQRKRKPTFTKNEPSLPIVSAAELGDEYINGHNALPKKE